MFIVIIHTHNTTQRDIEKKRWMNEWHPNIFLKKTMNPSNNDHSLIYCQYTMVTHCTPMMMMIYIEWSIWGDQNAQRSLPTLSIIIFFIFSLYLSIYLFQELLFRSTFIIFFIPTTKKMCVQNFLHRCFFYLTISPF